MSYPADYERVAISTAADLRGDREPLYADERAELATLYRVGFTAEQAGRRLAGLLIQAAIALPLPAREPPDPALLEALRRAAAGEPEPQP